MAESKRARPLGRASFLVVLGWLACASNPAGFVPAQPQHPERVALAPANFNANVPELLEPGMPVIVDELEAYLEEHGCEVERLSFETVDDVWRAEAGALGSLYDEEGQLSGERFDAAVAALVAGLQERGIHFDALVLPYLTLRTAKLRGKAVLWDGVRQKLRIDFAHHDVLHVSFSRGETPAVSVRVVVFDADGVKQLDRHGGLEIVNYVRVEQDWYYWHTRTDLFETAAPLRDGIEFVFAPYFGS